MVDSDNIMKALVALVIEKVLLDIGEAVYETVVATLYKKYHCYIPSCYEKPECLKAVLKELYGTSYNEIINSIEEQLREFRHNKEINVFLQTF